MNTTTGKYVILIGAIIIIAGIVIYLFHDKLSWLGKLPGDIHVKKENYQFYFPITTMILLSLATTLLITIIRKLL